MTTQKGTIPPSWQGTEAEWTLFVALNRAGKIPGRDFRYRGSSPEGGITFQFMAPPDLGINVTGMMQDFSTGTEKSGVHQITRQPARGLGVHLIFIDDVDLKQDPTYYVEEALKYRDHSHMGG